MSPGYGLNMIVADPVDVQAQLERIVASPAFSASSRAVQFLRFCVEQSLKGNHDQIKETTLAVEVFGRSPDYDPKADPIVRVHARRLRDRLDSYYAVEGARDPIRISIPKGGYVPCAERHVAGLYKRTEQPSAGRKFSLPEPAARPRLRMPMMRWFPLAVSLSALGLVLLAVSLFAHRPKRVKSDLLAVKGAALPLNAAPGMELNPTWSPDGKSIAFSWASAGQSTSHIYAQRIGDTAPTRLTNGSEAEFCPVWSPDGSQIAFIRYLKSGLFEVWRIALSDHRETSVGQFSFEGLQFYEQPGLDWSPDGKSLLVTDKPSATGPVRLVVINLASESRRPLTSPPPGSTGDLEGKFSPDGKLVAFHRGGLGDLYVVSSSGDTYNAVRRLTSDNPGVHGIAWSRDGRRILFGSMEGGHGWGIWQVSVDGGAPAPVLAGSLDLFWPAISPDGLHLAVEQQDVVTNLTAISLDTGAAQVSFAPSSRQDFGPAYSPNGRQVVFLSTRSGSIELWLANSDGSAVHQLTWLNGNGFPVTPSWSPDGKGIAFAIRRKGATNLAVTRLADQQVKELTNSPDRNMSPVYDADGRYIYYDSNADGIERIWRIAADGSGRPENMFWDAPWTFSASSGSARSIYYQSLGDDLEIDALDLKTGAWRQVFRSHELLGAPGNLCVNDKALYMLVSPKTDPSNQKLLSVNIASGKTTVLKNFTPALPQMYSGCSVSPDGHTLLVPAVERLDSDIYMAALGR